MVCSLTKVEFSLLFKELYVIKWILLNNYLFNVNITIMIVVRLSTISSCKYSLYRWYTRQIYKQCHVHRNCIKDAFIHAFEYQLCRVKKNHLQGNSNSAKMYVQFEGLHRELLRRNSPVSVLNAIINFLIPNTNVWSRFSLVNLRIS